MADPLNPQAKEMADESMVRNLAAQAEAIWPQEQALFTRYALPDEASILDAGCGTGEISMRLAGMFERARLLGVDIIDDHLARARVRCAAFGDRTRFENRSIFELGLPDAAFDLVVCRHVLQAVPHADRVIAELARVTRRGGWLHFRRRGGRRTRFTALLLAGCAERRRRGCPGLRRRERLLGGRRGRGRAAGCILARNRCG